MINKKQTKKHKLKGRGLIESEIMNGVLDNPNEADLDAEINEMHGLAHL
jgi:hypothetical protein